MLAAAQAAPNGSMQQPLSSATAAIRSLFLDRLAHLPVAPNAMMPGWNMLPGPKEERRTRASCERDAL